MSGLYFWNHLCIYIYSCSINSSMFLLFPAVFLDHLIFFFIPSWRIRWNVSSCKNFILLFSARVLPFNKNFPLVLSNSIYNSITIHRFPKNVLSILWPVSHVEKHVSISWKFCFFFVFNIYVCRVSRKQNSNDGDGWPLALIEMCFCSTRGININLSLLCFGVSFASTIYALSNMFIIWPHRYKFNRAIPCCCQFHISEQYTFFNRYKFHQYLTDWKSRDYRSIWKLSNEKWNKFICSQSD